MRRGAKRGVATRSKPMDLETMRLYRCSFCKCGFVIFLKRGKENKGITCPLCAKGDSVEEVDPVDSIGATLAKKAFEWWRSLP